MRTCLEKNPVVKLYSTLECDMLVVPTYFIFLGFAVAEREGLTFTQDPLCPQHCLKHFHKYDLIYSLEQYAVNDFIPVLQLKRN